MKRNPLSATVTARLAAAALALAVAAPAASAAEVQMQVSSRETCPNVPVTVEITVEYQNTVTPPEFPPIAGVQVRTGAPVTSSNTTIFNGRMSRTNTIKYTYQFVAQSEGEFTIPAVTVEADGKKQQTKPTTVVVSKSDTGELLFVEVESSRDAIYLGEQLELTLRIWLRPFRDRSNTLDVQDMWNTIDRDNTTWGIFADRLQERGSVSARNDLRVDSQNARRSYFVYEAKKTLWPEKAGLLDVGDIRVVVQYPTQVGQARDRFFFLDDHARVQRSRPIAAAAQIAPIEIKSIPTAGRPPGYTGAVGRHDIEVIAKPTEVTVGDPITLTMTIQGTGRLDVLQGPDLLAIPGLSDEFSIPTDPMAGIVDGNRKRFNQSIRPRREDVNEIPAIPFSYFDPQTGRFETVHSDAIPIQVKPASKLAPSEIVDATGGGPVTTELREQSHGILANYADINELLSQKAFTFGWGAGLIAGLPPVAFGLLWGLHRRSERLRADRGYARRRTARPSALHAIRSSTGGNGRDLAATLAAALSGYVADCCDLPSGTLTRGEIVGHLRDRALSEPLIGRVDELLCECEDAQYGGAAGGAADALIERTRACVEALEREKL